MNQLILSLPNTLACATCMGPPGHKINIAAGNAILFMVGIVAVILLGICAMIYTLARRARKYNEEHEDNVPA